MTRTTLYLPDSQRSPDKKPSARVVVHKRNSDDALTVVNESGQIVYVRDMEKQPGTAVNIKAATNLSRLENSQRSKDHEEASDIVSKKEAASQPNSKNGDQKSKKQSQNNIATKKPPPLKYSTSQFENQKHLMNADEKVKANLFGLGGHKDVSSEMFGKQESNE